MIIIGTTTQHALDLAPTPIINCSICHQPIQQADSGMAIWRNDRGRDVENVKFVHREGSCKQIWARENDIVAAEEQSLDMFFYTVLRTLAGNLNVAELEQRYARRGEGASFKDQV